MGKYICFQGEAAKNGVEGRQEGTQVECVCLNGHQECLTQEMLHSMPQGEEWNDRTLLSTVKSWKYLPAMAVQFNFMSRATKGYNPAFTHTL